MDAIELMTAVATLGLFAWVAPKIALDGARLFRQYRKRWG